MKAVLDHTPGSIYDDLPEERYHFPATYLHQVEAAVDDFIIYYEPGRTGQSDRQQTGLRSYVATARLTDDRPDPRTPQHYYAIIDPSTYLSFDRAVPFHEGGLYYERALRKDDGTTNLGAFGRPVRSLPDDEFDAILRADSPTSSPRPRSSPLGRDLRSPRRHPSDQWCKD